MLGNPWLLIGSSSNYKLIFGDFEPKKPLEAGELPSLVQAWEWAVVVHSVTVHAWISGQPVSKSLLHTVPAGMRVYVTGRKEGNQIFLTEAIQVGNVSVLAAFMHELPHTCGPCTSSPAHPSSACMCCMTRPCSRSSPCMQL